MADDWEPIPITITPERVEQWYRGKTSPRDLAYKAVWLRLIAGKTEPTVWRTIEAALAAYEGSPDVAAAESRGRTAGYAEAVMEFRTYVEANFHPASGHGMLLRSVVSRMEKGAPTDG